MSGEATPDKARTPCFEMENLISSRALRQKTVWAPAYFGQPLLRDQVAPEAWCLAEASPRQAPEAERRQWIATIQIYIR
jgi:hypothetical protein